MKRKRGHNNKKKGKTKKVTSSADVTPLVGSPADVDDDHPSSSYDDDDDNNDNDNDSVSDGDDGDDGDGCDDVEGVSKPDTPPPPPLQQERVVVPRPAPTAVYGRVKVKLKGVKPTLLTPLPHPGEEEKEEGGGGSGEKVEVSGESGSESRKDVGGVKIVSSSLSPKESGGSGKESGGGGISEEEREDEEEEEEEKVEEEKRPKVLNKQELEASLEVIKKVMKMDAAEPFNVPVNPVELGIPDYFDVIDTPMDFGTIHNNLESGDKYMDSEDVYKDVEYIWNNCFKYNNKGDYIVDLMKRVKKNFMKHWMAAGLYTEETNRITGEKGGDSSAVDEPATSGPGKKYKRGKGFKLHKDDCMCAICIMRRRRREREAREAQEAREAGFLVAPPQIRVIRTNLPREFKQEKNANVETPGEDTSSDMETSRDGDADAEMEDGEMRLEGIAPPYYDVQKTQDNKVEFRDKSDRSGDASEKSLQNGRGDVDTKFHDENGGRIRFDGQTQPSDHPEAQSSGYLQQRHELLELEKKRQRLRLLETFRDFENPMLLGLCGTLFPNNVQTVWNGANSLVRCQRSRHSSDIHEAVTALMNPLCKSASSLK